MFWYDVTTQVSIHEACKFCHFEPWGSNPEGCFHRNLYWIASLRSQ